MKLKLKETGNVIKEEKGEYGNNADRLDKEAFNKYMLDLINCNDNYNGYYKNTKVDYDTVDEYIFDKAKAF